MEQALAPARVSVAVILNCKHRRAPNHNSGGCRLKKDGISSEQAKRMVAASQKGQQESIDEPLNALGQIQIKNSSVLLCSLVFENMLTVVL